MSLRPSERVEVQRGCYKASVDAEEGRREDFLLKQRHEGLPSSAAPGGSWLVVHAPGGFLGQSCPARAHGSEEGPIPGEASRARGQEKQEKRINPSLVRYNEYDHPICRVCNVTLKSEALWPAHQVSRKLHELLYAG